MMKRQEREDGYTLVESIMFIGVVCMLSIAIIALVNSMLDKYRMSRVTQQIVDIQKNINFRFSAAENYKYLTLKNLIEEKIVPGDMVVGDKIYHAYKGEVTIKSINEDRIYFVTFNKLPYNACVELAMVDWMTGYTSNLMFIDINGVYATWQEGLPMTYSVAMGLCDNEMNNYISWYFQ